MIVDSISDDSKSDSYFNSLLECQFNSFKVAHIGSIKIIVPYYELFTKNTVVFIKSNKILSIIILKRGR